MDERERGSSAKESALTTPGTGESSPLLEVAPGEFLVLAPGVTHATPARGRVDICFVFDTTGSMSDKIDGLVGCMVHLVGELARLDLDWRVTTVPFGDLTVPGDSIDGDRPFVSDRGAAEHQLRTMRRNSGGGNTGESSIEAMQLALLQPFRREAVRVIVLLTDEPALTSAQQQPDAVGRALRVSDSLCFVASPSLTYFQDWARENGGRWYRIGPSMDTSALIALLGSLVIEISHVAKRVHELGGGSVRRYLELSAGDTSGPR